MNTEHILNFCVSCTLMLHDIFLDIVAVFMCLWKNYNQDIYNILI